MKKSEMQRMLAGFLSTIYETDKHPMNQLERACMVLNMLEEVGMRPPFQNKTPIFLSDYICYTWENENDI